MGATLGVAVRNAARPARPRRAWVLPALGVVRGVGRVRMRAEVNDEEQRFLELMRVPDTSFDLEDLGDSWEEYFAQRSFAPKNRAACTSALSVPLTILDALRRFELPLGEVIRIDVVGPRKLELSEIQLLYQELCRAFELQHLELRLVGPELPEMPQGDAGAFCIDNLRITFYRMFYQDFLSALGPPHMAVAFHAGIHEYDSWSPALYSLIQLRVPTVITGYSLADISKGLQAMRSKGINPSLLYQGVNSFASCERLRVDEVLCQLSLVPEQLDTPKLKRLQAQVDAAGGLTELMASYVADGKPPPPTTTTTPMPMPMPTPTPTPMPTPTMHMDRWTKPKW